MKLYAATCTGNAANTSYPNEIEIKTQRDFVRAVTFDHMASAMKDNNRANSNFIGCDCIMVDIDNTHTEDPDGWKTADDISEAFPVKYELVRSRNYMKEKRKTDKKTGAEIISEPREKWHMYFPLAHRITDAETHAELINNILCLFPFIDPAAKDPAHFFFGVADPQVTFENADKTIDEYLASCDQAELKRVQETAILNFAEGVENGNYKDNKYTRLIISTGCTHLKIKNPLPDASLEPEPSLNGSELPEGLEWIRTAYQRKSLHWLEEWAAQNDVELGRRYMISETSITHAGAIAICVTCPWEEEHSPGEYPENESVILVERSGQLSYLCRHSHGAALNWKVYRAKIESQAQEATGGSQSNYEAKGETDIDEFFNIVSTERYKAIPTGIEALDRRLSGGLVNEWLVIINAAPGAGKTVLATQILENMARAGRKCLYFNFEMSKEQLIARSLARIVADEDIGSLDILRLYKQDEETQKRVFTAGLQYKQQIAPNMLYNPDRTGPKLEKIIEAMNQRARNAEEKGEPAPIVCIDYLQMIEGKDKEDVKEAIKRAVYSFKEFAEEHHTIVICISAQSRSANNDAEARQDAGRDTSNIEYSADLQLQIKDNPDEEGHRLLYVTKSRFVAPSLKYSLDFIFNGKQGRFIFDKEAGADGVNAGTPRRRY